MGMILIRILWKIRGITGHLERIGFDNWPARHRKQTKGMYCIMTY